MSKPRTPEQWKRWFRQNKREDCLVIPKDLRWILGAKNHRLHVTPRRQEVPELLLQARDYIIGEKSTFIVQPVDHQRLADSVAACAIV